jgi:predicted PurR-regulated permease PerM
VADPKTTTAGSERIFVRRVLIVLGLATLFFLAWQLRSLLLMFFGAIVIASIFRAIADGISRVTGWRSGVGTALSIITVLGLLAALIALFGAQVREQVNILSDQLPAAWAALETRVGNYGFGDQLERFMASITTPGGASLSGFGRTLMSVGSGIADLLVVMFAGIYLATQPNFYRVGVLKLIPPRRRKIVDEAMGESERALRLWLKGQAIAMVVVGLLTGTGLWLLGMPSALTLGLLAGLLEFVPFAGPLIAAVPAVLLSLVAGPEMTIWVCLLYLAVQQFEGNLLTPMIQQYVVELPGVVLLFSLIGFGTLFGTLGIILAAPLAVVTMVLVKRLYVIDALDTETPIPGESKS